MRLGDNASGDADNQQGSRQLDLFDDWLTPQRLHAELLAASKKSLEGYLQGALRDGTRSIRHRTHRIGQSDSRWLELLKEALRILDYGSWLYREGRSRHLWILETTAPFLSVGFDTSHLVGAPEGFDYVRGYFDAEGGMPRSPDARLYLQLTQKDRRNLESVRDILEQGDIHCGRIHNPSRNVDPNYWRFYVRSASHEKFMSKIGSWHPRKRKQIETRMKI
jgi:hypothetical protein